MPFSSEYVVYPPLLVLVYLVIDLMLEVRSLRALLGNLFFWLYWFVYSVSAAVALYLLRHVNNPSISDLPLPILNLLATVGTAAILQSLSFRLGGKKIFELSRYLDDYRREVLSSSANLVKKYERNRDLRLSRQILDKAAYKAGDSASEERMHKIYAQVMLFGSRDSAQVSKEIAKIELDCKQSGADPGPEFARRVAQADHLWVRNFLAD